MEKKENKIFESTKGEKTMKSQESVNFLPVITQNVNDLSIELKSKA